MKKALLNLMLLLLFFSCDKGDGDEVQKATNKLVLLQVDFMTSVFEGGKELEFSQASSFTISSTYQSPGDFGGVQLFYDELGEKIFDGTIIWMGKGEVMYPEAIDLPNSFSIISDRLPLPEYGLFENLMYDEFAYYPEVIEYSEIWNSISNLEIVSNYRSSNPQGKIYIFLYTPSVGVGDPADWNWYVILKN